MLSPQPNVDAFQSSFNLDPRTHNRQLPMPERVKASEHFIFFPSAFLRAAGKPRSLPGNRGPWLLTSYQAAPCVSDPSCQTFGNLDPICLGHHLGFYLSVRMSDMWRWEKSSLCADWRNHCRVIPAVQNEAHDHVSQVCDTFWSYCARTLWRFGACVPFDPHTLLSRSASRVQCRQGASTNLQCSLIQCYLPLQEVPFLALPMCRVGKA